MFIVYPHSKEIQRTDSGTLVYGIDDADKKFIAVSIDFMNAVQKILVAASGSIKANMVQRAWTNQYEECGCPVALVESQTLSRRTGRITNGIPIPWRNTIHMPY